MGSREVYELTRQLKRWRDETQLTTKQLELVDEITERLELLYEVLP
jgi:hypothetical protein